MGIKIKKKTSSSDEPEILEGEVDGDGFDADVDALPEDVSVKLPAFTGGKKANPLQDNPAVLFGAVGVIVVLVVVGFSVLDYMEKQRVTKSSELNPAFQAYLLEVEGSPSLEPLKERTNLKLPTLHADHDAKWNAIYAGADKALPEAQGSSIEIPGLLIKAAAAAQLGKQDEAAQLYQTVGSKKDVDASLLLAAELGQANAHASEKEWDKALESLSRAESNSEDVAKFLRYHRARLLEAKGDVAKAKEIYHEILESDPLNAYKADIERRLAIL